MMDEIIGVYEGVPVADIKDVIKEIEKRGFAHEEAIELAKLAMITFDLPEEFIDKFNSIPN